MLYLVAEIKLIEIGSKVDIRKDSGDCSYEKPKSNHRPHQFCYCSSERVSIITNVF